MAISLASLKRGVDPNPPRILVYGPEGLGKTTFASEADRPVFIRTEDGLGVIDAPAFPLASSFEEVMEALASLGNEQHQFGTIVIDSVDWLEGLIHKKVVKDCNVANLGDIPYGKGFIAAMDHWGDYISAINWLRNEKKMTIVQIAHSQIKKYQNPETDPYDMFQIKLHEKAAAKLMEHSDAVLFVNYQIGIKKGAQGFNGPRIRAVGGTERIIYTEARAAFQAKNRYNLPPEISFTKDGAAWGVLAEHVPFYRNAMKKENANG